MEPHILPQSTWQLATSHDEYLRQHIPWWHDLDTKIEAELRLECMEIDNGRVVDVVVIGAGVAGLSAALSAREAGAEVLVLEATASLGRGATGRNAGILSAGINMGVAGLLSTSTEARFWPRTTRLLLDLVEEAGRADSLLLARLTGALSLAESASAARRLMREIQARQALGLRAEWWTPAQVAQHTGDRLNTSRVTGAMWLPDEGRVHPLTLLAHLARQARTTGVRLAGQARVASFAEIDRAHHAAGWRVVLAGGPTIEARGLLNAVGPTSHPQARIYALSFPLDLPATFPLFWDAAPYTYADYRAGDGHLVVSGGRYGKAGDQEHAVTYYRRLAAGTRHWLPELVSQEPSYRWGVDLDVTTNTVPHLRPLGARAPGLAIEGLGALGVLPGIILARRGGTEVVQQIGLARS